MKEFCDKMTRVPERCTINPQLMAAWSIFPVNACGSIQHLPILFLRIPFYSYTVMVQYTPKSPTLLMKAPMLDS